MRLMASMSRDHARAYSHRWQEASRRETAELRETGPDLKLGQLEALVASRHMFPVDPSRERESHAIRERWDQLRLALAGG